MLSSTTFVPMFASLAAAVALANPPAAGPDYTSLPPEPAAVHKQLSAAKVTATQAASVVAGVQMGTTAPDVKAAANVIVQDAKKG